MTADEILAEVRGNFTAGQRRKFLPGLLIALINFLRDLDALGSRFASLADFYAVYPRVTRRPNGTAINTLVVQLPAGGTKSIRGYYDVAADWFRSDQKRFDYPSSAPHATQAWGDYTHWIEALLQMTEAEAEALAEAARQFVLDTLPSQAVDPSTIRREPPRFLWFLERFDMAARKGEATGAAYQGTVFGYIRADAPHLQVEVGKVRTGSKREKRVGDVDARDGADLVLSAEVKQFTVGMGTLADLAEFAHLIAEHRALGLIVALDFEEAAAEELGRMGLVPISRADLIERVRIWDPLKQEIAMNAVLYYAGFREQSSALYERIRTFIEEIEEEFEASEATDSAPGAGEAEPPEPVDALVAPDAGAAGKVG